MCGSPSKSGNKHFLSSFEAATTKSRKQFGIMFTQLLPWLPKLCDVYSVFAVRSPPNCQINQRANNVVARATLTGSAHSYVNFINGWSRFFISIVRSVRTDASFVLIKKAYLLRRNQSDFCCRRSISRISINIQKQYKTLIMRQ